MAKQVVVTFAGNTANLEQAFSKVKADAGQTQTALGSLKSTVQSTGAQFGPMGNMITQAMASPTAAVGVAGAAIAKFVLDGVAGFTKLAEQTRKLAEATGATTQEASGFIAIGDDYNVTAEQLQGSFFKLEKTIGSGKEKLGEYGAEVVRNAAGGVDLTSTVASIADAYQATTDPANRAALLVAAFGKSGADMIPIVQRGGEAIRDMFAEADKTHQILSPEDVQVGEEYRLAMDGLGDAFKGIQMTAGKALVPFLTDLANAISKTVEFAEKINTLNGAVQATQGEGANFGGFLDKVMNKLGGLDKPAEEATGAVDNLGHTVTGFGQILGGVSARFQEHSDAVEKADAFWKDYDKVAKEATKTFKANEKAVKDGAQAVIDLKDAQLDLRSSNLSLGQSQHALGVAQDAYNKFLETGGIDAEKVKAAQEDLVGTQKDVERATLDVAAAQEAVNKALHPASLEDQAKAGRNVADANDAVTIAQLDQTDAQADYMRINNDATASQEDKTRAWVRANDAARTLADAQDRVKDATAAQTEVSKTGTTASDAYKDANATLIEKQGLLTAAVDKNAVAQGALNTEQGIGKDHTEKLWAVTDSLKSAQLDLDQKTWGAQKAQLALAGSLKTVNGDVRTVWGNVVGLSDELKALPTKLTLTIDTLFLNPQAALAGIQHDTGNILAGTRAASGTGGGGTTIINMNGVVDNAGAARAIRAILDGDTARGAVGARP